jgi:hypothetical protein
MISIARLTFRTEQKFKKRDAEKLRGFFAAQYREQDLFHNHQACGTAIYRMPLIQYKVINGQLTVFGLNEAVPVLAEKFLKVKALKIDDETITHFETSLELKKEPFLIDENLYSYQFITPWLAVNQKNYLQYINKKLDLDRVLQNNLLSCFKGLGIHADRKIMVKGDFQEKTLMINNIEYFGFTGRFTTNVKIPQWFGIGKFKAVGYGCCVRENKK